jgi:hypothetical protein
MLLYVLYGITVVMCYRKYWVGDVGNVAAGSKPHGILLH